MIKIDHDDDDDLPSLQLRQAFFDHHQKTKILISDRKVVPSLLDDSALVELSMSLLRTLSTTSVPLIVNELPESATSGGGSLRISKGKMLTSAPKVATSFDDSALVELWTSVLKTLSIDSGYLVIVITDPEPKVETFSQAVVPALVKTYERSSEISSCLSFDSLSTMPIFHWYSLPRNDNMVLNLEVTHLNLESAISKNPLIAYLSEFSNASLNPRGGAAHHQSQGASRTEGHKAIQTIKKSEEENKPEGIDDDGGGWWWW